MWVIFALWEGFENQIQLSGGQLIVAGLDGDNTIIFCKAENANKSLSLRHRRRPFWAVFSISFACFYPIFLITGSISYYFNNIY